MPDDPVSKPVSDAKPYSCNPVEVDELFVKCVDGGDAAACLERRKAMPKGLEVMSCKDIGMRGDGFYFEYEGDAYVFCGEDSPRAVFGRILSEGEKSHCEGVKEEDPVVTWMSHRRNPFGYDPSMGGFMIDNFDSLKECVQFDILGDSDKRGSVFSFPNKVWVDRNAECPFGYVSGLGMALLNLGNVVESSTEGSDGDKKAKFVSEDKSTERDKNNVVADLKKADTQTLKRFAEMVDSMIMNGVDAMGYVKIDIGALKRDAFCRANEVCGTKVNTANALLDAVKVRDWIRMKLEKSK